MADTTPPAPPAPSPPRPAPRVAPLDLPGRDPADPFVVAWWADKGGVGKTTWACHMAYEIGARGLGPVLQVDTNVHQARSSSSAVFKKLQIDPPYACTVEADPANLARVRRLRSYRYVVEDLPPSPDEAAAGLGEADVIFVPAVQEFLAFQGVMETIEILRETVPESARRTVVLLNRTGHTRGDRQPRAVQQIRQGLTAMGVRFFAATGRAYNAHQHAQAHGIPLTHSPELYDNGVSAAADVRAVVDEFMAMTRPTGGH
jgi:cellulose biosynthesis protein BcsQ